MTTQSAIQKRGRRSWLARILIALGALMLVLGAATWVAGVFAKANLIKQYPSAGQLVDVGGNKMHIYCVGQGSPTVFLAAGLNDFSIMWSLVQPEVAKFSRVCAYDRAGLGWSGASFRPRNSATLVKELHALLVNTKIEPPYMLVGHSFGGALVELYAQAFPDEIAGMVLIDAAPNDLFDRISVWRELIQKKSDCIARLHR